MGTTPAPITTTLWLEDALAPQTMMMVVSWTIVPLVYTRIPPE
jgi:hypothetical protein